MPMSSSKMLIWCLQKVVLHHSLLKIIIYSIQSLEQPLSAFKPFDLV